MKHLSHEVLKDLLVERTGPCISVYLNPAKGPQQGAENERRLKGLLEKAEIELRQKFPKEQARGMLAIALQRLPAQSDQWKQPLTGMAIFTAPEFFRVVPLRRAVDEGVWVADSFHTKPLMRATQFSGRYQILCVSQRRVAIYEGNQDGIEELDLTGIPANIMEAMKEYSADPQTFNATPGSVDRTGGGSKDAADDYDTTRFFRVVDQAVWERVSRDSALPLILAAVDEYHNLFHKVSKNPNLMAEGIRVHPDSITNERLKEEAWKLIEPYYQKELDKLVDNFREAKAHKLGSDEIDQVAQAATFSRVATLLVDSSKQIGGKIDKATGNVEFGPVDDPALDDVLDDIAEAVLKTGGQVLVIPPEQMPTDSGVAAIYRY